MLEFTLVGIPCIFVCISIVEMARGMWQYHTLQYAAKTAAAYASVHGASCDSPNSCSVKVSDVVGVFNANAIGIPRDNVVLTLTSEHGSVTCNPLSTCSSNGSWSSRWPPATNSDNAVGNWITVRADYTFSTALVMVAPGAGTVTFGSGAGKGKFDLPGYSYQLIQF